MSQNEIPLSESSSTSPASQPVKSVPTARSPLRESSVPQTHAHARTHAASSKKTKPSKKSSHAASTVHDITESTAGKAGEMQKCPLCFMNLVWMKKREQRKHVSECTEARFVGKTGHLKCAICDMDLGSLTAMRREAHAERCVEVDMRRNGGRLEGAYYFCMVCESNLSNVSVAMRIKHVIKCAKKNGVGSIEMAKLYFERHGKKREENGSGVNPMVGLAAFAFANDNEADDASSNKSAASAAPLSNATTTTKTTTTTTTTTTTSTKRSAKDAFVRAGKSKKRAKNEEKKACAISLTPSPLASPNAADKSKQKRPIVVGAEKKVRRARPAPMSYEEQLNLALTLSVSEARERHRAEPDVEQRITLSQGFTATQVVDSIVPVPVDSVETKRTLSRCGSDVHASALMAVPAADEDDVVVLTPVVEPVRPVGKRASKSSLWSVSSGKKSVTTKAAAATHANRQSDSFKSPKSPSVPSSRIRAQQSSAAVTPVSTRVTNSQYQVDGIGIRVSSQLFSPTQQAPQSQDAVDLLLLDDTDSPQQADLASPPHTDVRRGAAAINATYERQCEAERLRFARNVAELRAQRDARLTAFQERRDASLRELMVRHGSVHGSLTPLRSIRSNADGAGAGGAAGGDDDVDGAARGSPQSVRALRLDQVHNVDGDDEGDDQKEATLTSTLADEEEKQHEVFSLSSSNPSSPRKEPSPANSLCERSPPPPPPPSSSFQPSQIPQLAPHSPTPSLPIPDYAAMSMADLKQLVGLVGVKPGTKSFMVSMLRRIWRHEHGEATDSHSGDTELAAGLYADAAALVGGNEADALAATVTEWFRAHNDWYAKVLYYQPLDVNELRAALAADGIECSGAALCALLDSEGIVLRGSNKRNRRA